MMSQYLPLGAFGKLPCYGDFLEGSVFQSSSQALKEWVFGGREATGLESEEGDGAKPKETSRRRFLYGVPGSVDLVAGVIRPSADQGKRRDFPFMVFTHFPRRLYAKNYALLPMALSPVWDALDDAWDNLANVATRAAFEEVVRASMVPAPEPVARTSASYKNATREEANRIFSSNSGSLDALLRNLPEVVGQLPKGSGGEGVRLELPVSSGSEEACFDVSFWIDLINHQFLWRRMEPVVFLEEQGAEKNRHVLLIFGILQPTDYALVMGCKGTLARVLQPARSGLAGGQSQAPADPHLTYAELLSKRFSAAG